MFRRIGVLIFAAAMLWPGGKMGLAAEIEHRFGTAILSVVVPDEQIAVAADSKAIGITAAGEQKILSECKVRRIGENVFFSATGLWSSQNSSLTTIIGGSFQEARKAREAILLIEKRVQSYLAQALANVRARSPESFRKWFDYLRRSSIILFGLQNGSLFLYTSEFALTDGPERIHVEVTRYECPGSSCPSGHTTLAFYGHTKGLDEYFRKRRGSEIDMAWIRNAMEWAIRAEPQFVGPPVDILRINKTGARWVQAKAECR
ncbi:MAG TPA: hypothetical protein VNN77_10280 [candidate division Zixibacteria bacterium]|nr:hypothetical protein [candidate division Zixibacteria bacterium]